jgi:hypothetical protein
MKIRIESPGIQQNLAIASSNTPATIFSAAIDVLISYLSTQNALAWIRLNHVATKVILTRKQYN